MTLSKVQTYILVFALLATVPLFGQLKPGEAKSNYTNTIFSREYHGGIFVHNAGFGVSATMGRYKGAKKVMEYKLEIMNVKHPQEKKSYNPYFVYEDTKSYVYGKLNSVLFVKPSYGVRKILTRKERPAGVQVSYVMGAGPSFAFIKPVYLEIGYGEPVIQYKSDEKYNPEVHNIYNILGRSSGLLGFDELKFGIGGQARFALNFEYASLSNGYKAIEVGAMLDVYAQKIQIMANQNNTNIFLNLYLSLMFGKKIPR